MAERRASIQSTLVPRLTTSLALTSLGVALTLASPVHAQSDLPDAPTPPGPAIACIQLAALDPQNAFPPAAPPAANPAARRAVPEVADVLPVQPSCGPEQCTPAQGVMSCNPLINPFLDGVQAQKHGARTPREKALLAAKGVIDPFNLLTIVGTSAISIASNAGTPYGPGVVGWAKLTGVTFTQDLTGEFFGTFLIPSIAHQDPHYHRTPNASFKRRIAHCIYAVGWAQSDDGRGMFNYATVVGSAAAEGINNLYVPYRDISFGAAAERYWTALATDPIGNFVTEFVPDLAQHFNVRIVLIQRIVNRVAIEEGGGP